MEKDKIIFFGRLPPPSTGENIVSETIVRILREKHSVDRLDISPGYIKKEGLYNKAAYYIKQICIIISAYYKLYFLVRKQQFGYLYFSGSSTSKARFIDFFLLKIAGRKISRVICHLHNSTYKNIFLDKDPLGVTRYLIKSIDTYICLSKNLSNELSAFIPAEKRTVLSNMIDRQIILSGEEFESKLQERAGANTYIITYISNFIVSKGYKDLAGALFLIPAELRQKIKVRFIGAWVESGVEKQKFIEYINNPAIKESIEYIGPVYNRPEIKRLLIESDIFCLPTYYPVEAQPLCIIEAMNAGNAIISTWHASIPEYITDGQEGLLVQKRDIKGLAAAIVALCNREKLPFFAKNSRTNYLDNFDEQKIKIELEKIFA